MTTSIIDIPVGKILPSPFNHRRISPVTVRPAPKGRQEEVTTGTQPVPQSTSYPPKDGDVLGPGRGQQFYWRGRWRPL